MFENLKGNKETKQLLRRLVAENRVPQALLFAGPEGIGKKQFALAVASSFVCSDLRGGLPCGRCAPCVRSQIFELPTSGKKDDYLSVYFSQHPDIGIVVPNKNTIYIDAVRNLAEEAFYRPYEGRARIFIVDEAEKLGLSQKNAANAILKTLEEPAATTHIILVTSKPSSILQTIHSRCQTIRFSPVSEIEIEEFLIETEGTPPADASLLARAAKGSISRAASINLDEYRYQRDRFLKSIAAASGKDKMSLALKVSEEITAPKAIEKFQANIEILESLVRDLLLISRGLAENITHADLKKQLAGLSQNVPADALAKWLAEIESLKSDLRFNINKKVGTDALFVKMAGMT